MGSELRPTLPAPQFWGIQDVGWPTGNDTSGNPGVPLGSRPAPNEARSVAAKLSLRWPGFTPGLAREQGIFRGKMRAGPVPPVSREGRATSPGSSVPGGAPYQSHVHPAVSSAFWFGFSKVYIQSNYFPTVAPISPGQQKSAPESTLPTPCLLSLPFP